MKDVNKKKCNILYTTPFGRMVGGGQWSLYYLIKHLNKDIFNPIVLCPEEGELAERMRGIGAEVLCVDVGRIRYLNPFVIMKFISLIKDREITLMHTDSSTETFYAGIAARIMRIPLIWHVRVSEHEWFLDRLLPFFSSRLILVAEALISRFKWLKNTQKMVVVYNGIDIEEFDAFPQVPSIREELKIDKETILLGCFGRIEGRKGQEYLIQAMKYIDNAKLILAGRGEEESVKRIKDICEQARVSGRVVYTGYREDIPYMMKEIDILVFPVVTGEGFSRVILEAMAAGKPVIATDNGGNPEAVIDGITGYIVPAKDSGALASKINELVKNKERREQMGNAGRKRVEEMFAIGENVKKIEKIYLEILSEHPLSLFFL